MDEEFDREMFIRDMKRLANRFKEMANLLKEELKFYPNLDDNIRGEPLINPKKIK